LDLILQNYYNFSIEVNMDNLKINGWTLNIDGWNLKCHFEELMWVQDDTGKFIIWHRENENEEMKAELITLEMLEGTWWTSSYHKMAVVGTKCICDGKSFHPIVEYSDRFVCNGLTLNKAEKAFWWKHSRQTEAEAIHTTIFWSYENHDGTCNCMMFGLGFDYWFQPPNKNGIPDPAELKKKAEELAKKKADEASRKAAEEARLAADDKARKEAERKAAEEAARKAEEAKKAAAAEAERKAAAAEEAAAEEAAKKAEAEKQRKIAAAKVCV
jgi:hypothetical protein